ncbi:thiamine pyrophosphate-binding protein [Lichenihabitans sp. PAMC28606]|uniref:thiamine pyrophosphate-binding protein n=1 Tax=Lichenihabitans sp. PAMC28606 TaxID=2880932 RepID=UPI001D0A9D41|nr:thiamine pyrophosphate-binding protein [Lichenihabitans sp. PAMC28606]UDL93203.1 thiamine pyrophosphate-binding protein [Lichenihabitans sp. PAMC28606]
MLNAAKIRTAAEVLVDLLIANGVEHVFCVPGESFLGVLDAFRDRAITVTVCRQEGGAAMMAEAVGKATGRPGVCFVTRGPGATNASAGIHIANQDSTPMIMFVGQVERGVRGREAFQELDYKAVFGSMTKLTVEIDEASRVPEIVNRAFGAALSGRPGPVVVSLPKDMLSERVSLEDAPPYRAVETAPGHEDLDALEALLARAARPLVILGGTRWTPDACAAVQRFAERFDLPVATSYRRAPLFDALHPNYAGDVGLAPNPKLIARVKAADLVVLCGGRFGEIPSQGYTLFDPPSAERTLVHIYAEPSEFGRVFRPDLAIHATPVRFAAALDRLQPRQASSWRQATADAHRDYLAWSEAPTPQPGDVNLGAVMVWLRDHVPTDTMLCNGAGNYAAWIHRFYRFRHFASHIAPTSASMGYGIPAAVAMQRLHPNRLVLSINGDGDFLMNGQDFATAVQYGLPIVTIIADNGSYGTIRMHQEREFPGRVSATDLRNPDFAAYARAFGGYGVTVERTADFPAAFEAARASEMPSIVHLKIDADAITPGLSLSQIREQALRRQAAGPA